MYSLRDYHYTLPPELIAQEAIHPHHDARLMVIDRASGKIEGESIFWHLDEHIPDDRVLFFNDSRVLPARIRLRDVRTISPDNKEKVIQDGEILFCQKQVDGTFEALVRPGNRFKIGTKIFLGTGYLEVVGISPHGRYMRAHGASIETIMTTYGELPLPPYIEYAKSKEADYQTSFAKTDGSVAAPTASLHFTHELLEKLPHERSYVTLHVGLGTFQGVDTSDIRDYEIHSETIEVEMSIFDRIADLKRDGKKILAVGTTVCRTLESLPYVWQAMRDEDRARYHIETQIYWNTLIANLEIKNFIYTLIINHQLSIINFSTSIYIYPGYRFKVVDDLITNFHLPESSLLMLVSTFLGVDETRKIYQQAIEQKYRFFSFGDGMYIKNSSVKPANAS